MVVWQLYLQCVTKGTDGLLKRLRYTERLVLEVLRANEEDEGLNLKISAWLEEEVDLMDT